MNSLIQCKTTILPLFIAGVLACFGLPQGVLATDLDGVLPGGNNADGFGVLTGLATGGFNTGNGWFSLHTNAQGNNNTAVGAAALFNNNQNENTAVGAAALFNNTIAGANTAIGAFALFNNINGSGNTASGGDALFSNTSGGFNTATGDQALFHNTVGGGNTATGFFALFSNTMGNSNTADGFNALAINSAGAFNTAVGIQALTNNMTGDNNTALGAGAGGNQDTGSDNIYIGDAGVAGESNTIAIGAQPARGNGYIQTRIGGIYDGVEHDRVVYIGSDGHLGAFVSSRRYKDDIKPMGKASEALFELKPVVFRYKQEINPSHKLSFGLIAEDVADISADLVSRDKEGKPQTVRYEAVNAMLLNEFLKAHRQIQEQEATLTQLKSNSARQEATIVIQQQEIKALTADLKEQKALIQKVSDKVEVSRPAPQMALNNE